LVNVKKKTTPLKMRGVKLFFLRTEIETSVLLIEDFCGRKFFDF